MMVSCVGALRYGGIEEEILKRLYEDGMADLCDHTPEGKYSILIRDRVSFNFEGLMDELANLLIGKFNSMGSHVKIDKVTNNNIDHFSFLQRWTGGGRGLKYDCTRKTDKDYSLQISTEKGKTIGEKTGTGALLHDFLKVDSRITNIKWFARNMPADLFYDKPY
jgi:hypothetical protein